MHRTVAALLVGVLGLVAPALPAAAQTARDDPAAPEIAAGVLTVAPAPGSSVDPAGTGFALTVDPGQVVPQAVALSNGSTDRRLTVRVQPVDARRSGSRIEYDDAATGAGGNWITASVAVVVVEPGATVDVPLTISVPADAAGGDAVLAGLRVYAERADSTTGAAPVIDALPVRQIPIALTVSGSPKPQLAVTGVVADEDGNRTFLEITVRNTGNAPARAVGVARAAGEQFEAPLDVEVDPRKEKKVRVEWKAVDIASGANVSIELEYGDGDTASWIGNVAADPEATVASVPTAGDAAPAGGAASTQPAASSAKGNALGTIVAAVIIALMVAAGGWLVFELARGRSPRTIAIDPATVPQLQVLMDPRHTEVLNALVTQVGALGGAIEKLAERAGVPVVIPPAPSPLRTPRGRHHGDRPRARSAPETIVMTPPEPAPPPTEPIARVTAMLQTPPRAMPRVVPLSAPPEPEPGLAVPPPVFIPPTPREPEPTDAEIAAFLERRRANDDE